MTILITPNEAAKRLSCSASTLAKARLTGEGPPYIKMGRSVRYQINDLDEWIAARRRQSTSESTQRGEAHHAAGNR